MKNLKKCCFAVIAIALVWSCQKEERVKNEKGNEMQFLANYREAPYTKATTSFTAGNKVTIYACEATKTPSSSTFVNGTPLNATAQSGGVLTPQQSLFLAKGSYNFYSVSQNSSSLLNLNFSSGSSEQLANDIDYLWAEAKNVKEGGTVSFIYSHKAVGIKIEVYPGTGVSNLLVTDLQLTPSKSTTSSKMNLATGVIAASNELDALTSLSLANNIGEKIMLPLTSQSLSIKVTANLTIGSTTFTGKVYEATIPASAYQGGTYYTLNLTINAKEITFSGSKLQQWTNQAITGVTLVEK